jgi:diguanylate cyclase (GGDEF)-like protein/PAS domain S-box-containing protein
MRFFIPGSIWSRLLFVIALGFILFVSVILSKNIPGRIEHGVKAQAAIKQLDAMRRPLLQIKALENRVIEKADISAEIADLNATDAQARVLLERFTELARYNSRFFALVEQFAEAYEKWIITEQRIFQHSHHVEESSSHRFEHFADADRLLLEALDLLGKAEDPLHDDIQNGRQAIQFIQFTGSAFIFYLFVIILIMQRYSNRVIVDREEDLSTTLRSIGDAVISTDIRGCITRMNPVAEQLTGWSIDEALGRQLSEVFVTERAITGEPMVSPVENVLANGQIVAMSNHTVLVSRDGIHYQIVDSAAPIKNKSEVIQGVVLVFHDVTMAYDVQQKVKEQASRLSNIIESSMDGIIAADENGTIVEWNSQAEIIFGWKRNEILGAYLHETIIPESYREYHLEGMARFIKTGESKMLGHRVEMTALHKSGLEFPIELTISQLEMQEGLLFSAFVRDLTNIKMAEQELKLAATTFESHSGIIITDSRKNILRVNPAMELMTGYSADEMIGKNPKMLQSDIQNASFYKKMWEQVNDTGCWQGELWNKRKDNSLYAEFLTITAVKDKVGNVSHYVGTSYDITERKSAEEKIEQLAYYDELTDLANRRLLLDRLNHEISVALRYQTFGSLLYLDLDRFKNLNDALGHPVGDELLRQVAQRLKEMVRSEDTVCRLGGDEFVVMLPAGNAELSKATVEASSVADKVRDRLSEAFDLHGYKYYLHTSIGIVVFPEADESPDDILKHADSALYQAKAEGRNTSRFYKPEMQASADARLHLEKDIRHALENNELVLDYQPQVGLDGSITGAEALLRWHHPQRGIILPNQFIPLAEETGLILDIGNWVLKTAIEQVSQWHEMGVCPGSSSLAVNVSPRQFHQANFVEYILELIESTGVAAGCIELEITESLLMDSMVDVVDKLLQLRGHGISIAIDDFGTGYSSLSYLKSLPLDKLKIDQSFVRDLTTDSNDAAIVDTIIAMSKHLGLSVIAEGVETRDQLDFLKSKGCEIFQGYYFSKAVSAQQMLLILKNNCI